MVRTGAGDEVSLSCIVHGRPKPDVAWTRDGRPVTHASTHAHVYDPHKHARKVLLASQYDAEGGSPLQPRPVAPLPPLPSPALRHTLTIRPVSEKDFGAYVCIAKNRLGQKDAVIQMTGGYSVMKS